MANQFPPLSNLGQVVLSAINEAVGPMTPQQTYEVSGTMIILGIDLLRQVQGDEYVTEWVAGAVEDIEKHPPVINFVFAQ